MQYNDSGFRAWPNDFANSTSLEAERRVVLDSSGNLAYAGATQLGLGTLEVRTEATDTTGTVRLWNVAGTRFMTAAGAISNNADVFAAANGKVAATGTIRIGRNVGGAATADGDQIEVLPDAAAAELSVAVAASAAVTNTTTETAFDNGSYTIPANGVKAGDVIRIRAQAIATATNSTDTLTVKLKIGSTVIATSGAVDVANNDIAYFDVDLVVRTVGASGTIVAAGVVGLGVEGTVTAKPLKLASTAIDTTAAMTLSVTATWSVANAGNSCRLDVLNIQHLPRVAA